MRERTEEQIKAVISEYADGKSVFSIATRLGMSERSVKKILAASGVTIRSRGETRRLSARKPIVVGDGTILIPVKTKSGIVYSIADEIDLPMASSSSWQLSTGGYVSSGGKWRNAFHRRIFPDAEVVDHINHNKLDNRRANLRPCDRAQNMHNRPNNGRYRGVSLTKNKKRYSVLFIFRGISRYGGTYDTEVEAARAWNALATKHYGEFACLNVIPNEGETGT